ncbi:MAG: phosphoenolpyruvate-utilizing N-terminal domain-containing protein, partial [Brevinematales bacterium]
MKPIDLLFNIVELNNIYKDGADLRTILDRTVHAISEFLKSTICSIYLYDEKSGELTMLANIGLNPRPAGSLKIKITEGLAGLSLRESRVVYEKRGSANPEFKSIPGINEEIYDAYLVLPIERGVTKIGVLMLQREIGQTFTAGEIKLSRIIASNLAIMIENARLMNFIGGPAAGQAEGKSKTAKDGTGSAYNFIKGKTASEGFHYSEIYKISQARPFEFFIKTAQNKKYTRDEFSASLESTENEIAELQKVIEKDFSEAASLIFGAHLLLLRDRNFSGEIMRLIEGGENPPEAIIRVATNLINLLQNSTSAYIKEKAKDIEDIAKRVLNNLMKNETGMPGVDNKIVVAGELLLSDLIRLFSEKAGGIILLTGGSTSHLSILARTLKIPVIIADDPGILDLPDSTMILMDAETGNIYINPTREIVGQFNARNKARS